MSVKPFLVPLPLLASIVVVLVCGTLSAPMPDPTGWYLAGVSADPQDADCEQGIQSHDLPVELLGAETDDEQDDPPDVRVASVRVPRRVEGRGAPLCRACPRRGSPSVLANAPKTDPPV